MAESLEIMTESFFPVLCDVQMKVVVVSALLGFMGWLLGISPRISGKNEMGMLLLQEIFQPRDGTGLPHWSLLSLAEVGAEAEL